MADWVKCRLKGPAGYEIYLTLEQIVSVVPVSGGGSRLLYPGTEAPIEVEDAVLNILGGTEVRDS